MHLPPSWRERERRPSVSLAIAKVTDDAEDGGLSIEFTTKQVSNSFC